MIPEFIFGYLQLVDQPDARFDISVMWDLSKNMMEYATEYPWGNVKKKILIVGSQVENERLEWTDTVTINKLRTKHAQKHEIVVKKANPTPKVPEKLRYCGPYQRSQCAERGDHNRLKHMCAFCYKMKATPYPHPEADCRGRSTADQSKNAQGGGGGGGGLGMYPPQHNVPPDDKGGEGDDSSQLDHQQNAVCSSGSGDLGVLQKTCASRHPGWPADRDLDLQRVAGAVRSPQQSAPISEGGEGLDHLVHVPLDRGHTEQPTCPQRDTSAAEQPEHAGSSAAPLPQGAIGLTPIQVNVGSMADIDSGMSFGDIEPHTDNTQQQITSQVGE